LVIDVSSVTDIKDLDNPFIVVNGVYDPEPFGFEGGAFGYLPNKSNRSKIP
jgi:hypothetical protein